MRITATLVVAAILSTGLALAAPVPGSAGPLVHVVRPGENLYRIALRYGVTVDAIARANGLPRLERIRPGQVLTIPRHAASGATAASSARSPRMSVTVPGATTTLRNYVVQRGDTLYSIARRHETTVGALVQANALRSDRIYPGQQLRIPGRSVTVLPARPPPPAPFTPPQMRRTTEVLPLPQVGTLILAPQALRVRRGPKPYFTTLALVAPETPLQVIDEAQGWYEVQLADGQSGWVPSGDLRIIERPPPIDPLRLRGADIVREAMRYLGTPYVWGGESARGVDCSGLVYIVFSSRLPALARLRSSDYFQRGTPVAREDLLPGDLVFFTTYAPGPSHVGIYVGEGRFIQASSSARRVVITSLGEPYYAARYLGARRLVNP